ncbi:MAG: UDP-glucuronic acid decarboxylase family protein [Pseudomonadota bacterium]
MLNYHKKKRVLVTGGAGFIGSHICAKLLEKNYEVICLDNFFTGRKANIKTLMNNPSFELLRHDIIHPILIEVEEIYNLACPASPIHYQHNAIKTIKTSVAGVINMLGLSKRTNAKILQASTSEVYGDPTVHPQEESYCGNVNPIGIRSCYDEGKRVAETLMMDYHRQNNVDIRIARIFNTYGPNMAQNDGRVVSNFICQALQNEDITIYGNGRQTRSFCFVDDLVRGLIALMETQEDKVCDKNDIHYPVNLGNPKEFDMLTLANLVIEITKSSSKIVYKELPLDDPKQRCPNISRAKNILNWEPTIELEKGLEATIAYFKNELNS